MMNNYRTLTDSIPLPPGLNHRVAMAAREQRKGRSVRLLPTAACAALAVALLAVPFTRNREEPASPPPADGCAITALAASQTENGALALPMENGAVRFLAAEGLQTDRGTLTRENGVYTLTGAEHGATLTLGTEEYRFRTEELGTFLGEDGSPILAPVLPGDDRETTPALYSATAESRFLSWPVEGSSTVSLSNSYGSRETPKGTLFHSGIDIPGTRGLPISAAGPGTVLETGFDAEQGNYLLLDHGDGLTTLYAHCQELLVQDGAQVAEGAAIALLGSTGLSTGPHLHFEVRREGTVQNPVAYFAPELRDTLSMG